MSDNFKSLTCPPGTGSDRRQIFSVSDLTRNIRFLLEQSFASIYVEGEISNFKFHTSGHRYFSLKDAEASLQCVMFRDSAKSVQFDVAEGMQVIAFGRISVYPVRGQYQLYVERMEPKGIGALQLRFEALKEKLKAEGLFDEAHKKPIPYLSERIGLVTSIDGAALQDILNILNRRFDTAHILIYPVPVQGASAAPAIAEAIRDFNQLKNVDVIITGRGGGSLEDLWAFNEEVVARAIYESEIPVISAVGHEVDFTIADFVADLRAPTPSAAAELVLPRKDELLVRFADLKVRAGQGFLSRIKVWRETLKQLRDSRGLKDPLGVFEIKYQKVDELRKSLGAVFSNRLLTYRESLASLLGKLDALGPLATLKRGFSVTMKLPARAIVRSVNDLKVGDEIETRLKDGTLHSKITKIS